MTLSDRYSALLDSESANWNGSFGEIQKVAGVTREAIENIIAKLRSGGKAGLSSGEMSLLNSMNAAPLTWGLGALGAGGLAGYKMRDSSADSDATRNGGLGFGAGLAAGLAAPSLLDNLKGVVGSQGFYPGAPDALFETL
jgi:hypothetical protein